MINITLKRRIYDEYETLGTLDVVKNGLYIDSFKTLENPWKNNERNISCIPVGTYIVEPYSSAKHPDSWVICNVPNRTDILIHIGNYYTHTEGCILLGLAFSDINNDNVLDIKYSSEAMKQFNKILEFESNILLTIK
jgi:hypothetical protein